MLPSQNTFSADYSMNQIHRVVCSIFIFVYEFHWLCELSVSMCVYWACVSMCILTCDCNFCCYFWVQCYDCTHTLTQSHDLKICTTQSVWYLWISRIQILEVAVVFDFIVCRQLPNTKKKYPSTICIMSEVMMTHLIKCVTNAPFQNGNETSFFCLFRKKILRKMRAGVCQLNQSN